MNLATSRPDQTLRWMQAGTGLLTDQIAALSADQLRQPCALPGWTRAHLLTHLARNAEALMNLTRWAATGTESPMYPGGPAQRNSDIASGVAQPTEVIVRNVTESAAALARSLDALPDGAWATEIRTAQGRLVPATLIPWMRTREVWIHAIDLGTDVTFDNFPADLVTALLRDVTNSLTANPDCPDLSTVTGPAPALLGWLTGRTDGTGLHSSNTPSSDPHSSDAPNPRSPQGPNSRSSGGPLPALPPWL
jgi:maleylpyruvate isomerase